jgi:uncharacterized protein YciW
MSRIDRTLSLLGLDRNSVEGQLVAGHLAREIARNLFKEAGTRQATDAELATTVRRMAAATSKASAEEPIACVLVHAETGEALGRVEAVLRHATVVIVLPKPIADERLCDLSGVGIAGKRYDLVARSEQVDHIGWTVKGLQRKTLRGLAEDQGEATIVAYWQVTP